MKDLCTPDQRNIDFHIDLDSLWSNLRAVSISDVVPEKIKNMIELVQKIYLYSFYEYDFYTLAMIYLSLLSETAIKEQFLMILPSEVELIRKSKIIIVHKNYTTIYDNLWKRWKIKGYKTIDHTLISILIWFKENAVLPERIKTSDISAIIYIRNAGAHLMNKDIYPPAIAMQFYWKTVDFVNCLFDSSVHDNEPVILREMRKESERIRNIISEVKEGERMDKAK